jgi:hypothetical protein
MPPGAVDERLAGLLYRNFEISDWRFLAVFADGGDETT